MSESIIAPIGGVSQFTTDLAPSVIFCTTYGILAGVFVVRLCNKAWRTALFSAAFAFAIERTVLFGLRSGAATHQGWEENGVTEYMQTTFAMGWVYIATDLIKLLRWTLVDATYTPETRPPPKKNRCCKNSKPDVVEIELNDSKGKWSTSSRSSLAESETQWKSPDVCEPDLPDQPHLRRLVRGMEIVLTPLFIASIVVGSYGTSYFSDPKPAAQLRTKVMTGLRYTSSAIGLFFTLYVLFAAHWARYKMPRINHRATKFLVIMSSLLTITGIYRLVVMGHTAPSEEFNGLHSNNTPKAKALFYALHILPETMVCFIFAAFNVRQIFRLRNGRGDDRWRDESPEEREKRVQKEQA